MFVNLCLCPAWKFVNLCIKCVTYYCILASESFKWHRQGTWERERNSCCRDQENERYILVTYYSCIYYQSYKTVNSTPHLPEKRSFTFEFLLSSCDHSKCPVWCVTFLPFLERQKQQLKYPKAASIRLCWNNSSLICCDEKVFCKHLWSFLNCKALFVPLQKVEKVSWPKINGVHRIWACWQNSQQVVRGKITNNFKLKSILTCNMCLIWEILSTNFLNWFIT